MKKKVLSVLLAVTMTAGLFAGCGSQGAGKAKEASKVEPAKEGSVVWWGWTPGSPTNEEYIKAFNEEYPNIKVEWKQVTIDDYDATLKPALANGAGVDAFEVSAGSANGGIEVFASQAIDMDDALKDALGEDYKDKLSETSIKTMTVDGKVKALGVGAVYAGNLWINKDLFDKYNVKIPTNMEEWKTACDTFKKNGIIGFVQGAGQGAFNMDTYHAICDNIKPGDFMKACQGEIEWTEDTFVKGLEIWKSLFDEGIMQDGALGLQQYPEANNLFLSQKAAMVMMGSWYTMNCLPGTMKANMESASSTDAPFTMIPIDFPDLAGTKNTGSMFSDIDYATAVTANSENAGAALTFALWLGTSQKGQQLIADSLNVIPVLKSATPDWDKIELVNPDAQKEVVESYLENAMGNPDNSRFGGISADLNQGLMDVLAGVASGTMKAEDGAAQLADISAESE